MRSRSWPDLLLHGGSTGEEAAAPAVSTGVTGGLAHGDGETLSTVGRRPRTAARAVPQSATLSGAEAIKGGGEICSVTAAQVARPRRRELRTRCGGAVCSAGTATVRRANRSPTVVRRRSCTGGGAREPEADATVRVRAAAARSDPAEARPLLPLAPLLSLSILLFYRFQNQKLRF
jgi:hypothetical protein